MSQTQLANPLLNVKPAELELSPSSQLQLPPLELTDNSPPPDKVDVFVQGVNVPALKAYYRKLERNINRCIFLALIVFLGSLWFISVESCAMHGVQSGLPHQLLKSLSSSSWWYKGPTSGGFGVFLLSNLANLSRLCRKRRDICEEHCLCKSKYYPTAVTPVLCSRVYSLFCWRINCFWLGFALIGLGLTSVAYSHICYGVTQLSSSSSSYDIFSKWFCSGGDYKHYMTQIGLIVVGAGLLSILTTNLPCRRNIKLALKLFGMTEHNMGFDLRDKVFRLNKRNKIAVLIILCVAGVGIYIIFKRLILAIFHKSFKYSKR